MWQPILSIFVLAKSPIYLRKKCLHTMNLESSLDQNMSTFTCIENHDEVVG